MYIKAYKNDRAVFNPDCCVTPEPAQLFSWRPGLDAETNPIVIVEVLSQFTYKYDFAEKLPCYQQIPGLQCILYVDSLQTFVTAWQRTNDNTKWQNTDYKDLESGFELAGKTILLKDIYSNTGVPPFISIV